MATAVGVRRDSDAHSYTLKDAVDVSREIVKHLKENPQLLETEGVFRCSGNRQKIKEIIKNILEKRNVLKDSNYSIHDIICALKTVIPDDFINSPKAIKHLLQDEISITDFINSLVASKELNNCHIAEFLHNYFYLHKLASRYHEKNKMPVSNLLFLIPGQILKMINSSSLPPHSTPDEFMKLIKAITKPCKRALESSDYDQTYSDELYVHGVIYKNSTVSDHQEARINAIAKEQAKLAHLEKTKAYLGTKSNKSIVSNLQLARTIAIEDAETGVIHRETEVANLETEPSQQSNDEKVATHDIHGESSEQRLDKTKCKKSRKPFGKLLKRIKDNERRKNSEAINKGGQDPKKIGNEMDEMVRETNDNLLKLIKSLESFNQNNDANYDDHRRKEHDDHKRKEHEEQQECMEIIEALEKTVEDFAEKCTVMALEESILLAAQAVKKIDKMRPSRSY